jgi:DNA-directed RNA polymerase subunit RPC12/RpoP
MKKLTDDQINQIGQESYDQFFRESVAGFTCPYCGSNMLAVKEKSYKRFVYLTRDTHMTIFEVRMVCLVCGKTMVEHSDWIIPYKRYSVFALVQFVSTFLKSKSLYSLRKAYNLGSSYSRYIFNQYNNFHKNWLTRSGLDLDFPDTLTFHDSYMRQSDLRFLQILPVPRLWV